MNAPAPSQRPLFILFHCGIYAAVYMMWIMSIGRRDVQDIYGDAFIQQSLLFMTPPIVGYVGLWFLRRWGFLILAVSSLALLGWGVSVRMFSPPIFIPAIAALTTAPLWPMMK